MDQQVLKRFFGVDDMQAGFRSRYLTGIANLAARFSVAGGGGGDYFDGFTTNGFFDQLASFDQRQDCAGIFGLLVTVEG